MNVKPIWALRTESSSNIFMHCHAGLLNRLHEKEVRMEMQYHPDVEIRCASPA
jgi:hypothetical protein